MFEEQRYFSEPKKPINLKDITASRQSRIKAHIIDRLITLLFLSPFLIWVFSKEDRSPYLFSFSLIFLLITTILYIIIPIKTKGKTLGKMMFRLRIVTIGGEHAESDQHVRRGLIYVLIPIIEIIYGYFVSIVVILFWFISLYYLSKNRYKQAIHDKYSYCSVVYDDLYLAYLKQLK